MRLGIDIRELERDRHTGIGRYLRNFIGHVSTASPECELYLYGNQRTDPAGLPRTPRIRIRRERTTAWFDQVTLPALAAADSVDLFLSPYMKGPLRLRCPLVVTIHDVIFLARPEYRTWRSWPSRVAARAVAAAAGRRAAAILTDSAHSAGDIERLLGLDRSRIHVLPLGVGAAYVPHTDPAAAHRVLDRYGVAQPYLLYVGNFKPHKNVPGLIRAFAALDQELAVQYQLVLAGRPDVWTAGCRRLAQELKVASRVLFAGAITEADLPLLYSAAELFVFPSLYEGFGLPPLEAMACGTPVLSSEATSLPEVVGDAGVLVDAAVPQLLAAAMGRLLSDAQARERLRAAGLARAARFRVDQVCTRQLELLKRVVGGGA